MTDLLRRPARAMAAVGLLLCYLTATAQESPAIPAGTLRVLDCSVAESLPVPPAEAREGGFAFLFESLGGTAVDGRACTVYRLRNLPGSPPTPVRWVAGSEVLVDVARLARCSSDAECAWLEVARYFDGGYVGGDTEIGYGLNADSFRHTSPGLVALSFPDVGAAASSVGTELVGTVLDSRDRPVVLDLVVKSRLVRDGDGLVLVYEATADDPSQLDGSRFVLAWEAFDLMPGLADGEQSGVGEGPFRALTSGGVVPVTHAEPGAVSVRVPAGAAVFRDRLALAVREPGVDGEVLLTVVLPAFLPGRR
jgi:hypothetical protein